MRAESTCRARKSQRAAPDPKATRDLPGEAVSLAVTRALALTGRAQTHPRRGRSRGPGRRLGTGRGTLGQEIEPEGQAEDAARRHEPLSPEAGVSTASDRLRSSNALFRMLNVIKTLVKSCTNSAVTSELTMESPPRASPATALGMPGIDEFGVSQTRRSSVRAVESPATLDHISGPGVQSTSSDNFHGRRWKRSNAPADQMAPGRLNAAHDPPLGSPKKSPVKPLRDSPASDFFGPSEVPSAVEHDMSPQPTQRSMARVEVEKQVCDQVQLVKMQHWCT